jgi:uncharacterized protein (UPF0332 family)
MANFDWANYLYFAEDLLGIQTQTYNDETIFRVAISRAYYATLIKARNYLQAKQNIQFTTSASLHSSVIDWFFSQRSRKLKEIGWKLKDLREWRNQVDESVGFGKKLMMRLE